MSDANVLAALHALSNVLVMTDPRAERDEWRDALKAADTLGRALDGAGAAPGARTLAVQLRDVLARLVDGQFAAPAAALGVAAQLAQALQGLENPSGIDEAARKQALAQAGLLARDADKILNQDAGGFEEGEQRELVIEIEKRLNELEQTLFAIPAGERDPERVRGVFREIHTLKGETAIIGLTSIADFWHAVENEIEPARRGEFVLTDGVLDALREAMDLGRRLLRGESREDVGIERFAAFQAQLRECAREATTAAGRADPPPAARETFDDFFDNVDLPPAPAAAADTVVMPAPAAPAPMNVPDAPPPPEAAGSADIPIPAPPNITGADLDVDDPFGVVPPRDLADAPPPPLNPIETAELSSVALPVGLRRRAGDAQEFAAAGNEERKTEDTALKAVPIDVNRLDALLELVNQVALSSTHVGEHALTAGDPDLRDRVTSLIRAARTLQGLAAGLRMTAIRPLFMTLRRAALDAARASRKLVEVVLEGWETRVDRAIVEQLSAALVHVVRNAVDHGIEPADLRRAAGKPERGKIKVAATRAGADVVIEFSDDGRGYDLAAIRRKAESMGLIAPDAALSEQETAELVFLPGLSTAKKVTGLSGRGVGMEIVKKSIDGLKGRVDIETAPGKGAVLRMRLPVALAALEGLLLRVGDNILVFPVFSVRECFRVQADQVSTVRGGGVVVSIRGVVVPVLFLDREFGLAGRAARPEEGVLALVEEGDSLCAVLVDEALEARQVLIRPTESGLGKLELVTGMALLPDRSVALVVDVRRLIERVRVASAKAFSEAGHRQASAEREVDTVSIGSNQVGMIDFVVAVPDGRGGARESVFAINAFKTREFVQARDLRSLPNAPKGFAGIQMLRGRATPIIHLGTLCGLMEESDRRPEWDNIVLLCEFAARTVGFLVTRVNRVSYVSWGDIMPPPESGGLFRMDYVVGTILMERLGHSSRDPASGARAAAAPAAPKGPDVAFVLDFERIVGNVIQLYGDMGADLGDLGAGRKNGVRLLLVEDSPLIRRQSVKALEAAGITVIQAGDGQEAWDRLEEMLAEAQAEKAPIFARLDLVMSDIEMPRMDGYTLVARIKKHPQLRVLPVLLHSSITNDMMIKRAQEVEADGFVPKCDPKELAAQLRKYL